jgi:hypothetical protein
MQSWSILSQVRFGWKTFCGRPTSTGFPNVEKVRHSLLRGGRGRVVGAVAVLKGRIMVCWLRYCSCWRIQISVWEGCSKQEWKLLWWQGRHEYSVREGRHDTSGVGTSFIHSSVFPLNWLQGLLLGGCQDFFSVPGRRQKLIILEHLQRVPSVFWIYATVDAFFESPESA